jgi:hypothetical protein
MVKPENTPKQAKRKPTRTAWRKGVSGNPGGRPKELGDLRVYCRQFSRQAVDALVAALNASHERTRVAAAEALLDRGYGRPIQGLEIASLPPVVEVKFANADTPATTAPIANDDTAK